MPLPEVKAEVSLSSPTQAVLARLQATLAARRIQAYIVGGLVRDLVLGRPTMDIDVAVVTDALVLAEDLATALKAKAVVLDEVNGVVRLLPRERDGEWQIDLSAIQGGLETDLARRDFTLDALAIDLGRLPLDSADSSMTVAIIDPMGGLSDIRNRVIRAVSHDVFIADGARLLRAVRLAAEMGFTISADTEALIRRDHLLIGAVAGERVREELLRLLSLTGTDETMAYMQELGLLTTLIPELEPSLGLEQPKEHTWDVFYHSLKSVAALDFLLRRGDWRYTPRSVLDDVPWNDELERHFEERLSPLGTHRVLTKLAALLHDVAKPQTRAVSPSGRTRFFGHPQQGAPIAAAIAERLRLSGREVWLVEAIVRHHLRPVQVSHEGEPTRRAVYRYFRDVGDAAVDTLFFSLADHLATRGPELDLTNWRAHASIVAYMLAGRAAPEVVSPARLIDGYDLQEVFGLKPGPRIGDLLEAVREAQAEGEVSDREDALAYLRRLLAREGSNQAQGKDR